MLTELKRSIQKRGVIGTIRAVTFGTRCQLAVRGKCGLEIGGPSELFRHAVPVYKVVRSLDNCVFSAETAWSKEDGIYGRNRIMDAVDLAEVNDGEYHFILSCHSLEHIANPIKALKNWRRVAPGYLVLILPYCRETHDHLRPITTLAHMVEDFERDAKEDDLTHLQEAIELIDFSRVVLPDGKVVDEEAKRIANLTDNPRNRYMHHHVFDEHNSVELLEHCGYRVLATQLAAASVFLLAKAS